jgi:hypothetical protein
VFYTIYKTTNTIDGKIYIGKHVTENPNDDYLGSGKVLKSAIAKYGVENFKKEILFIYDNEVEMNAKEAELVTEDFVKEDTNYNLCPGGRGGFGYINSNELNRTEWHRENNNSHMKKMTIISRKKINELMTNDLWREERKRKSSAGQKKYLMNNENQFKNKSHTEEWKKRQSAIMKEKSKGENNSQFGKMWITNGTDSVRIMKTDVIPEGWYKGRKIKL